MSSQVVYQGKYVQVQEEQKAGHTWEKIYLPGSLLIFPITEEGKILFIKEERPHENPSVRWKPITGFYEEGDLEENTNRELQEEVALKANIVEPFLEMKTSGTLNVTTYVALAWELEESFLPNPDGDVILGIEALSLEEIIDRTMTGEFERGIGAYAYLRLQEEVRRGWRTEKKFYQTDLHPKRKTP